jgi:flagellar hook-associated protein 1 FlgK
MPLSTFHTLHTAKNSLIAHQKAISTVGHNIANQANEDYSRQRVQLGTLPPIDAPGMTSRNSAGQVGQGVEVKQIERIRDAFVEDKILVQSATSNYWETKASYLRSIESIYNEPNGLGVKSLFDNFLNAWNDLALDPTEPGARETLKATGRELADHINSIYENLSYIRKEADRQIIDNIEVINQKANEIAKLNGEIFRVKAEGKNPNDLMDKRDALVEDLSKFGDINVTRKSDDFIVFIGSQVLVTGDHARQVYAKGNVNNEGMSDIFWQDNGNKVHFGNGEIKALLDVRDVETVNQIDRVDNFAASLVTTVNDIHSQGFGLNGNTGVDFFSMDKLPLNLNGDYDSNGDGVADSTAIMKVSGTTSMAMNDKLGIRGVLNLGYKGNELRAVNAEIAQLQGSSSAMDQARLQVLQRRRGQLEQTDVIEVQYFETDTVQDVINRINASEADVVAYLNHNGQFTIKALKNQQKDMSYSNYAQAPDFAIKHLEDSGYFLTTFTGILRQPQTAGDVATYDWSNPGAISSFVRNEQTGAIAVDYDVTPMTHPSSYISLSRDIETDSNNIATRLGEDNSGDGIPDTASGISDNRAAWKIISALRSDGQRSQLSDFKEKLDSDIVVLDKTSSNFLGYIDRMVQEAGSVTREAVFENDSNQAQMLFWKNKRQQISGVSLDEELATMLTYEHAYRASAKVVNVVDTMLETIINRMGV